MNDDKACCCKHCILCILPNKFSFKITTKAYSLNKFTYDYLRFNASVLVYKSQIAKSQIQQ